MSGLRSRPSFAMRLALGELPADGSWRRLSEMRARVDTIKHLYGRGLVDVEAIDGTGPVMRADRAHLLRVRRRNDGGRPEAPSATARADERDGRGAADHTEAGGGPAR